MAVVVATSLPPNDGMSLWVDDLIHGEFTYIYKKIADANELGLNSMHLRRSSPLAVGTPTSLFGAFPCPLRSFAYYKAGFLDVDGAFFAHKYTGFLKVEGARTGSYVRDGGGANEIVT